MDSTPEWKNPSPPAQEPADPMVAELHRLQRCVRYAFGLAKAGASSRGYLLLCEARGEAAATLGRGDPCAEELLHHWDAAVRWFERHALDCL